MARVQEPLEELSLFPPQQGSRLRTKQSHLQPFLQCDFKFQVVTLYEGVTHRSYQAAATAVYNVEPLGNTGKLSCLSIRKCWASDAFCLWQCRRCKQMRKLVTPVLLGQKLVWSTWSTTNVLMPRKFLLLGSTFWGFKDLQDSALAFRLLLQQVSVQHASTEQHGLSSPAGICLKGLNILQIFLWLWTTVKM